MRRFARLLYPSSIRVLTLVGFALVSLPLIIVLILSLVRIGHLSQQSASAIRNASRLEFASRQLVETLDNVERSASQYKVLHDADFWRAYITWRKEFHAQVRYLKTVDSRLDRPLASIVALEKSIDADLENRLDKVSLEDLQARYISLGRQTNELFHTDRAIINGEVSSVESSAAAASQTILYSVLVIPLTLIVALLFIRSITRPLNLLKPQIKELQLGNLNHPISATGASEVVEIATILDDMRRQLLALEEGKNQFIMHVSHDFKTPLAALKEGAALLQDGTAGHLTDAQKEISSIISDSVNQLQSLIEDLLNFNMVLDDSLARRDLVCSMHDELARVLDERRLQLDAKSLRPTIVGRNFTMHIHPQHMRAIFDNLISNAIRFSPPGGEIQIQSALDTEHLRIEVADCGPGIPPDARDMVFEPFFSTHASYEGSLKSTGLGLSIVNQLVHKYRGEVRAACQAIGGRIIIEFGCDILDSGDAR